MRQIFSLWNTPAILNANLWLTEAECLLLHRARRVKLCIQSPVFFFISAIVYNVNHDFSVSNITILTAYPWIYTLDDGLISEELLDCLFRVEKTLPGVNVSSVCDWTELYIMLDKRQHLEVIQEMLPQPVCPLIRTHIVVVFKLSYRNCAW